MMSKPVRILWLDPADFLGGAEFFSLDVLPILSKSFEINVLTSDENSNFSKKLEEVLVKSFEFPRLKPISPKNILRFFQTVQKLKKYIELGNFDLVHTNSIRTHILAAQALRSIPREKRPKLSFFVHDFTFPRWGVKLFAKRADIIFSCSDSVRNDLIQKGVEKEKIHVVPNGVDSDRFGKIISHGFEKDAPVIGMLGRIDTWKGQDVFLKASKIVLEKYPKARLKIFGESSAYDRKTQEFEQDLKKFVEEKNLKSSVEFCGFVPSEKAFSVINICVHASTKPEPFGRVIIEALAAGVPLIASNLGGSGEIFEDGVHGFLIPPNDPDLLAAKIITLIESEELRKLFSQKGKELILKRFTLQKVAEMIDSSWKEVL